MRSETAAYLPEPLTVSSTPRSLGATPTQIADAVLSAFAGREATSGVLRATPSGHVLELHRGSGLAASFAVDDDRAAAVAARLAVAACLDPTPEPGAPNSSVMRVATASHEVEVRVAIATTEPGLRVELDVLTVDRRGLTFPSAHALRRCAHCGAWASANESSCRRDGSPLDVVNDDPRPGGTVGAWIVGRPLGVGGMGEVFSARHALIGRAAAIKIGRRSFSEEILVERFLVEARAVSRLRHPSIVATDDFGVLADGRPYLVMELLSGISLAERLARSPALTVLEALHIAHEIADALATAHEAGVVHHDLKPSNIMLLEDEEELPRLKLVDFGAANIGEKSRDEAIYGTLQYMSPERIYGEAGDGRSDVYSLGVVLYEALSGAPPFDHASGSEIIHAQLHDAPPAFEASRPLPKAVSRLLERALAKPAEGRYQSAREMADELRRTIELLGAQVRR
jgi:serine/threonine-protein kinase